MLKTNKNQLTTMELAKELECHPNTIYKYVKLGMPSKVIKSSYRFELDRVVKWLEEGCEELEAEEDNAA